MSRSFLVGNFLPAYGRTFGRLDRPVRKDGPLTAARLAVRFDQRARRHRERQGAYVRRLQLGGVVALLVTIGAFRIDVGPEAPDALRLADQELVAVEEIAQTLQVRRPPPPPRPPVPVEVPDDAVLEDIDLDLDVTLDVELAVADLPPPPPEPEEEDPGSEIFFVVEEMPEMVGGMAALVADLDYPEIARKAEMEGMVVVQVTIPPSGIPADPKIVRSVAKVLDNAAIEAVMRQTFTPGRQRGRPVTVAINIPVTFRLS